MRHFWAAESNVAQLATVMATICEVAGSKYLVSGTQTPLEKYCPSMQRKQRKEAGSKRKHQEGTLALGTRVRTLLTSCMNWPLAQTPPPLSSM